MLLAAALTGGLTGCVQPTPPLSAPAESPAAPNQAPTTRAPEGATSSPEHSATTLCPDGATPREMRFTDGNGSGRWGGTIREHSGKRYRLEATLQDDGCELAGTFSYVELGCSGTWAAPTVEDVSEPQPGPRGIRARITETVTHDPDRACASTAQVQLVYGPAGLLYLSGWDMPDGSEMESRAHLEPLP